jgi:hypothetical protein
LKHESKKGLTSLLGYAAAILWRGIIWPCGAFEGGQIISVPPSTLKGPAVRIL